MIQLLTIVVIVEGIVAVLFSIDVDPIRKVVRRINYAASSKISAVVGTLAGTMFVILGSSINSIMKIQGRSKEFGAVTPTDQILMKTHMLEASLMVAEAIVAVLISIDLPPIRKVVRKINYTASSRMSAVVGTLAGTMFVILGSSINSITKIQGQSRELGAITPTDQILLKTHMLEASLMGYALLLGLLIDRLHYFVQRVDTLKREAKKFREPPTEEKVKSGSTKMKLLKDEIFELRQTLQKLSLDSETVEKQAKSAEANAKALEEQAQSFLIKYDHLEEENQKLHSEISELKNTSSNVHSKKDA